MIIHAFKAFLYGIWTIVLPCLATFLAILGIGYFFRSLVYGETWALVLLGVAMLSSLIASVWDDVR